MAEKIAIWQIKEMIKNGTIRGRFSAKPPAMVVA
jgi:hypothetical protein